MGQGPFEYPTPDGYPEEMMPWLGTLLWRWNFALALASNDLPGVAIEQEQLVSAITSKKEPTVTADLLVRHFTGRKATKEELNVLRGFEPFDSIDCTERERREAELDLNELFGLVLSCPAFQMF